MKRAYRLWTEQFRKLPKPVRYTLGTKIDGQFLLLIDLLVRARYKTGQAKLDFLHRVSEEFDILKYFVTMLWEEKQIEDRIFTLFAKELSVIGKSLGKWIKHISEKSEKR